MLVTVERNFTNGDLITQNFYFISKIIWLKIQFKIKNYLYYLINQFTVILISKI